MKMNKIKDYGRFYALLKKHPAIEKEDIVLQFTDGRTTHLREMKASEYIEMCDTIEGKPKPTTAQDAQELKRARSSVLLRIGRLGINTIDNWDEIDQFCLSPKIAGKRFCQLDVDELRTLVRKLESIINRGGLKWIHEQAQKEDERQTEAIAQATIQMMSSMISNPKFLN